MKKLRWRVIGIGHIVQSTIAPAMVTEPEMDLVAAVSRDQDERMGPPPGLGNDHRSG